MGTVASIGESTKELRKNDSHLCNSPLNFAYITKGDNLDISAKSLAEYAQQVKSTALSSLFIPNAFDTINFNDLGQVKTILTNRFTAIQGDVRNRISGCLSSWN